ncbi:Hypothetical predicted protein [Pelobates cultripes]|uniref:Uncharacterized protein n=1 Tax=Pelobates cultripes TaxID=61616 RepID=A0AAD1SWV4_PELCU|nr:Hypothetical predicted protein [Pelobates cultripes]
MTPWVRPSPSESSLATLLFSIPSHKPCFDPVEHLKSPRAIQPVLFQEVGLSQTPLVTHQIPREKTIIQAKQRSRTGLTKKRSANKLYSIKLPPVPEVTELSFSRNFSFSFFELPEHQNPQQWLQRQRLVHIMMSELLGKTIE